MQINQNLYRIYRRLHADDISFVFSSWIINEFHNEWYELVYIEHVIMQRYSLAFHCHTAWIEEISVLSTKADELYFYH